MSLKGLNNKFKANSNKNQTLETVDIMNKIKGLRISNLMDLLVNWEKQFLAIDMLNNHQRRNFNHKI